MKIALLISLLFLNSCNKQVDNAANPNAERVFIVGNPADADVIVYVSSNSNLPGTCKVVTTDSAALASKRVYLTTDASQAAKIIFFASNALEASPRGCL